MEHYANEQESISPLVAQIKVMSKDKKKKKKSTCGRAYSLVCRFFFMQAVELGIFFWSSGWS